jgi:hypothetical protein
MIVCMNILTRADAIQQREALYFTGVPCRRGHLSPRYTKNGSCKECLHPVFISVQSESNKQKKDIHQGMTIQKFRFRASDIQNFKNVVWAISMLRRKHLQAADIETKRTVKTGAGQPGTYLYPLWIFLEDEPYFRGIEKEWNKPEDLQNFVPAEAFQKIEVGKSIWPAESIALATPGAWNAEAARRRALENAEREAAKLEEPPEWKA